MKRALFVVFVLVVLALVGFSITGNFIFDDLFGVSTSDDETAVGTVSQGSKQDQSQSQGFSVQVVGAPSARSRPPPLPPSRPESFCGEFECIIYDGDTVDWNGNGISVSMTWNPRGFWDASNVTFNSVDITTVMGILTRVVDNRGRVLYISTIDNFRRPGHGKYVRLGITELCSGGNCFSCSSFNQIPGFSAFGLEMSWPNGRYIGGVGISDRNKIGQLQILDLGNNLKYDSSDRIITLPYEAKLYANSYSDKGFYVARKGAYRLDGWVGVNFCTFPANNCSLLYSNNETIQWWRASGDFAYWINGTGALFNCNIKEDASKNGCVPNAVGRKSVQLPMINGGVGYFQALEDKAIISYRYGAGYATVLYDYATNKLTSFSPGLYPSAYWTAWLDASSALRYFEGVNRKVLLNGSSFSELPGSFNSLRAGQPGSNENNFLINPAYAITANNYLLMRGKGVWAEIQIPVFGRYNLMFATLTKGNELFGHAPYTNQVSRQPVYYASCK